VLEQLLPQLLGPTGALVLACVALGILWRQSRRDLAAKDKLFADQLADKNADIAFERSRTADAEKRLEDLGGTLMRAADVMESSVEVTEKTIEFLRSRAK